MENILSLFFILVMTPIMSFGESQMLNQLVYKIRDPKTESSDFRNCLEKIGEYVSLKVLQELETEEKNIITLTGRETSHPLLKENPVLVTILRAGLPLNYGAQKVFPDSCVGFLAMSRNEETLITQTDYIAIPDIKNKNVIITDTMLATGGSLLDAIKIIKKYEPKQIYVVTAIAAKPGLDRIHQYDSSIKVFYAVLDPELNDKGYIIPGLGDAGDRSFGKKAIFNEMR